MFVRLCAHTVTHRERKAIFKMQHATASAESSCAGEVTKSTGADIEADIKGWIREPEPTTTHHGVNIVAGGTGGMVSALLLAPFARVALVQQLGAPEKSSPVFRSLVAKEGFRGGHTHTHTHICTW